MQVWNKFKYTTLKKNIIQSFNTVHNRMFWIYNLSYYRFSFAAVAALEENEEIRGKQKQRIKIDK